MADWPTQDPERLSPGGANLTFEAGRTSTLLSPEGRYADQLEASGQPGA